MKSRTKPLKIAFSPQIMRRYRGCLENPNEFMTKSKNTVKFTVGTGLRAAQDVHLQASVLRPASGSSVAEYLVQNVT